MTGRTVKEWVGSSPDAAIPRQAKARIWRRCEGKCALTGRKLTEKDADYDHITPLSMGGKHAESNLQIVCRQAHREKTAAEAGPRAKADRIHAKHFGYFPPSKTPLKSGRGFPKRWEQRS